MTVKLYKIVRFRADEPNLVIERGLTLSMAKMWCNDPRTHGDGWFDGYEVENPTPEELQERAEKDAQLLASAHAIEALVGAGLPTRKHRASEAAQDLRDPDNERLVDEP